MRFRILGSLEVFDGTAWKGVPAAKQRMLLTTLLINRDGPVTVDRIREHLWGDDPPRGAVNLIQQYVMRLRRTLNDDQGKLLVTRPSAYELRLSAEDVDAWLFARLESAGRSAQRAGEHARASSLFAEALALWRGPALADVQPSVTIEAEIARLTEHRLAVIEARVDADLRCARHTELIPELRSLVDEHPLREHMWGQLMIALYRSGRKAEALRAFRDLHQLMKAELGVEPAGDVRQLHQRMLDGDPALDPPRPPATPERAGASPWPAPPERPVPRQLPSGVPSFAGRVPEIRALSSVLSDPVPPEGSPRIVLISGMAGIGKTALALHCAHRLAMHYPDGQLYVNLRGFGPSGPPLAAAEVMPRFLTALSVPPAQIAGELDAQVGLYRSLLAGRRVLIVLDNAHSADQVRPLLPGSPSCSVVVTSRDQLLGLTVTDDATRVDLDVLDDEEARDLLAGRLGAERLRDEEEPAAELIALCGGLPLALAITAARAAAGPKLPLATLAGQLRAGRNLLDALDTGDTVSSVRSVFSWSYRALSRPAAWLFRMLSLLPGADFTPAAAASLSGARLQDARAQLAELADTHLVDEHLPGHFALHDLLRTYAAELSEAADPPADRRAAAHRVLEHYLHSAYAAARLLSPHRDPIALSPAAPGVRPEPLADHDEALSWFTAQHAALLAAVRLADELGLDAYVWQLAWSLADYLDRQGHWHDQISCQRRAVEAAERGGHPSGRAAAYRNLARAHLRLTRYEDAHDHYFSALAIYEAEDDAVGQAHTYGNLSAVRVLQEHHLCALDYARRSLQLFERAGHRAGMARALNAVGWYQLLLRDYDQAVESCTRALGLHTEIDDRHGLANTYNSLGLAHRHLGEYAEATACYQRSVELYQSLGDRYNEADTLTYQGENLLASGDRGGARRLWRRALHLLDDLGHPDAARLRERLRPGDADEPSPVTEDGIRPSSR